ncbi:MAG: trypsin-like peptidase domain-containing protein [Candidatus Moranbacteria bacterium]|nr:trypsin-like peptidase domain-containing protein [Candidatus Moranbacteria bacterium]
MKNKILLSIILALVFFLVKPSSSLAFSLQKPDEPIDKLTQEELVNLAKPAVVRIIQHVEGQATIYPFDLDFSTLSVNPLPAGEPMVIPIDEYLTGSGVIINPNGFVLTNSHVISYQTIKLMIAGEVGMKMVNQKALTLSAEEGQKITQDKEKLTQFGETILEYLLKTSKFEIKKSVFVLNPSSIGEKIEELTQDGFQARVVSVNDDFYKNNEDAAVIKIEQKNLPSVKMGNSDNVKIGDKIFVFGYPSTAEFNRKNLLEATFTQGSISSMKDSEQKDFKIFQTDAKVSKGSSGGPLFNEKGEVVGIVTYQTNEFEQDSGDNFAFAIPIGAARKIIGKTTLPTEPAVSFETGNFYTHFFNGLEILRNRHGGKAIAEFNLAAANSNQNFAAKESADAYLKKSQDLIAAGNSIDNTWEAVKDRIKSLDRMAWVIVGASFLAFIILVIVIIFLSKRLKKEEKEINVLEQNLVQEQKEINSLEKNVSQGGIMPASKINPSAMDSFVPQPQAKNPVLKTASTANPFLKANPVSKPPATYKSSPSMVPKPPAVKPKPIISNMNPVPKVVPMTNPNPVTPIIKPVFNQSKSIQVSPTPTPKKIEPLKMESISVKPILNKTPVESTTSPIPKNENSLIPKIGAPEPEKISPNAAANLPSAEITFSKT